MNFSAQIERNTALIYDLRITEGGDTRFYILRVRPPKKEAFVKAFNDNNALRLEDFGTILYRGWDEPDDDLKAKLREQYGMYSDSN